MHGLYRRNKGLASNYFRQAEATGASVTLTPLLVTQPKSDQKQIITSLWFYRGVGGTSPTSSIRIERAADGVDLAEIVFELPTPGGEFTKEIEDMCFIGDFGEALRAVFVPVDSVLVRVKMDFAII